MNDVEQRIHRVLDEDAREAPRVVHAPADLRRRVRRRQVGTALVAVATSFVVVAAALAGAAALRPTHVPLDQQQAGRSVTTTIEGVTITWPSDWTLLQLDWVTTDWGRPSDGGAPAAFRPLLQLSNFDPGPGGWICPLPTGQLHDDNAVLYVEAVSRTIDLVPGTWPAEPSADALGRGGDFGACGVGFHAAAWVADGVTYEAYLYGNEADYARLLQAYRSMTFSGGVKPVPHRVDQTPLSNLGEAYVLASGSQASGPWNLLAVPGMAYGKEEPCLVAQVGRTLSDPSCVGAEMPVGYATNGGDVIAFGIAPHEATGVAPTSASHAAASGTTAWPDSLRSSAGETSVWYAVLPGAGSVELTTARGAEFAFATGVVSGHRWQLAASGPDGTTIVSVRGAPFRVEPSWLADHALAITETYFGHAAAVLYGLAVPRARRAVIQLSDGRVIQTHIVSGEGTGRPTVFWAEVPGDIGGDVVALDARCIELGRYWYDPQKSPPPVARPAVTCA